MTSAAEPIEIHFYGPGTLEWDMAWNMLEADVGDVVAEDPETGEVWQYMGHVRRANGRDRKSTRLNSSHIQKSRMPSSA